MNTTEQIYYVDENDNPTGEVSDKLPAHHDKTRLHAAFSSYIFNDAGLFLVTQRAFSKKVWPRVWTNSCCGHPAPNETREDAILRRLDNELGMSATDIKIGLPEYRYTSPPYNGIIENEFCPLYFAKAVGEPIPNPAEVEDYKWVEWDWFLEQIAQDSNDYSTPDSPDAPIWSWWCKDQLKQLKAINADPYEILNIKRKRS